MKYLSRLLAGALLVSLTACSSDEPTQGSNTGGTDSTDPLYSTITIAYPGSRSGEGNEGEEIGKGEENIVSSVFVVLATSSNDGQTFEYLASAENDSELNSDNKLLVIFKNKEDLVTLSKEDNEESRKVYVFAYCNPSVDFTKEIKALEKGDSFTDKVCSSNLESTWSKKYFLMTNIDINSITLPKYTDLKDCDQNKPFDLGKINVVRTAVRFDIKDGSANKDWTYSIKDYLNPEKEIATVKFDKMAVFNQRNSFYYLPRVKAEISTEKATLCPGWVGMSFAHVNNVWTNPFIISPETKENAENYNFKLERNTTINQENEPALNWKSVNDIVNNADRDDTWNPTTPDLDKTDYYILDYTSENTLFAEIPDGKKIADVKSSYYSTGVVFRAEITVKDKKNEINGVPQTMYVYKNTLYYNSKEFYKKVLESGEAPIKAAFENCFTVTGEGDDAEVTEKQDAPLKNNYITAYRPVEKEGADKGKYFCYYVYYNQHVDDGKSSSTGKMEYATVRNNIYKLSVSKVNKLGDSEITEEGHWDIYFRVEVVVKNWVVRVNNKIEF